MPVIPDFQPAAQSGAGFAQSQSLMQRAQAGRRAEEAAEMDRQKFEIMRPILESQARGQLISEAATMSFQKQMADYAASEMMSIPVLTKEWTEIRKIADPVERLQAQSDFIGRTAPLEGIPSAKPMVETWRNLYVADSNTEKTNALVSGRAEVTGAVNDARAAKTQADNETKLVLKQKDAEIAQMKAEHAASLREAQLSAREREVEAKTKSNEKIAEGRAAGAGARPKEAAARKYNETEVVSRVRPSTEELPKFLRALDILEDPAVRTGTAAGLETAARRFGEVFGFNVGKVGSLEELQSTLGSSFLNYVGQMKGAISDKETQALISMSPGVGKTAAGNIALVNNIVQALSRNIAMGGVVLEGRDAGETEAEIQSTVLRSMIDTPMGAFMPARGNPVGGTDLDAKRKQLEEVNRQLQALPP